MAQNIENCRIPKSLPLFLKYSVKCLFLKLLYQTVENVKYILRIFGELFFTTKLTKYDYRRKHPSYRLYPDFHQHPNQQNRIQVRHPDFIALPISGHVFRKRRAWHPVP